MYCNGSLITEEIIRSFSKYPPRIVEVTLYGASEKTFEAITRKSGSFAACRQGIDCLRRAGVRVRLKTVVLTLNYEELPAIRKTAEDMGLQFRHDCSIIPALPHQDNKDNNNNNIRTDIRDSGKNGLRETLRFRLDPEQAAAADISAPDVKEKLRELTMRQAASTELSKELYHELYHCGAGRSSYHITPYGEMQPCIITLRPSVDLVAGTQRFRESWNILHGEFTQQKAAADFLCNSCSTRKICTGCPSTFALETGYPEDIPPFYCQYTECRRQAVESLLVTEAQTA